MVANSFNASTGAGNQQTRHEWVSDLGISASGDPQCRTVFAAGEQGAQVQLQREVSRFALKFGIQRPAIPVVSQFHTRHLLEARQLLLWDLSFEQLRDMLK